MTLYVDGRVEEEEKIRQKLNFRISTGIPVLLRIQDGGKKEQRGRHREHLGKGEESTSARKLLLKWLIIRAWE